MRRTGRRRPGGTGTRRVLAVLPLVLAGGLAAWMFVARRPGPAATGVETAGIPAEPARDTVSDTLGRGMTLGELMAANGLSALQVHEVTQRIREFKLPRTLLPGAVMRFSGAPGAPPDELRLQMNPDSILHMSLSDSGWTARLEVVPLVVDTVRISGVIQSSLWLAQLGGDVDRLEPGGFEELVYDLADVFMWKIDFTRDIRKGDGFRVAFEREVRPDGSVRSRRFLAIELHNRGRVLAAIPYERPGGSRAYYDTEGRSLRGAFLRYPVPYRITSRFTNRRYHPVLKRYRAHRGIDYGAPHGTRVQATASGTVTRAGWWGDYGRMVEIRHANGITTRYGHLSAIAAGIRAGAAVAQGQYIGRVGSTGLATGPHLHYEFRQHGRARNPLTVSVPSEPPLAAEHMAEFRGARDAALGLLGGLAIPSVPPMLADGSSP